MKQSSTTTKWRTLALVLASVMIGGALIGPVAAGVSFSREDRKFIRKTARKIANKRQKKVINLLQPQIDAKLGKGEKAADADKVDGVDSAAFLDARSRGAIGVGISGQGLGPAFEDVASVQITVPGTTKQLVKLDGVVSVSGGSAACPCNVNIRFIEGATGTPTRFDEIADPNGQAVVADTWLLTAAPGTHTYRLQAAVFQAAVDQFDAFSATIVATTIPLTGAGTTPAIASGLAPERGDTTASGDATASGRPAGAR